MKTLIKPCPFCGGKAEFRFDGFIIECEAGWVQCVRCNALSEQVQSDLGDRPKSEVRRLSVRRWNRRI